MSQRVIYNVLKEDLGGCGTFSQIREVIIQKHPDISLVTINHKLTRMRKWGRIGYNTHKKLWSVTGEF